MARNLCLGLLILCLASTVLAQIPANFNTECNNPQTLTLGLEESFLTTATTGTSSNAPCGLTNDVWYTVQSTCSSLIQFSTCNSQFDTIIAIYPGDVCINGNVTSSPLVCNDDAKTQCKSVAADGVKYNGQSFLVYSSYPGQTFLVRVGGFKETGYGKIVVTCGGDIVLGDPRVEVPSVYDGGSIAKYLLKDANYIDIVKNLDFYSSEDGINLYPLEANISDISISNNGQEVVSSGEFYVDNKRISWSSLSRIENSDNFPPHSYVTTFNFAADDVFTTNARIVALFKAVTDFPRQTIVVVPDDFPSDSSNRVLLWQNKGAFFGFQTDGSNSDFEGFAIQKKGSSLPPFSRSGGLSGVSLANSTAFPEYSKVYGTAELSVLFSIRINGIGDANAGGSSASFFISPTSVAMNETYVIWQNTTLQTNATNGLLLNDVNYDYAIDSSLTASLLPSTANQSVVVNPDGTFTYTPPSPAYAKDDTFKYLAKSGSFDRSVGFVTVSVRVDDRPRPVNDTYYTTEKVSLVKNSTLGVMANDLPAYKLVTVVNNTAPLNGSVVVYSNGSFVYTPSKRFNGNDTFYYTIANSRGERAVASVTIVVAPFTYLPVALNDTYPAFEDQPLYISAAQGVLANDTDLEETGVFTAVLVNGPLDVAGGNASLSLQPNGSFVYTPPSNYNGLVNFTYTASNGENVSNVATVTIVVAAVNDAPTAVDDVFNTKEHTLYENNVLLNDYDIDGDNLTVSLVEGTGPYHAANFTLLPTGVVQYKSVNGFNGDDTFVYQITDASNKSSTARVTIQVVPVNDPPVAYNDTYELEEGSVKFEPAPGVLANDYDPDNDTISSHIVNTTAHGSILLYTNGSFVYTPAPFFTGNDSFTYYAYDDTFISETATVFLIIKSVPSPPIAMNDNYTTLEDVQLRVLDPAQGVLANDYDPDEGDVITAKISKAPTHGTVQLNPNGTFIYTPNLNFNGYDSFSYVANDGVLDSQPALVRINVTAVNDPPVPKKDHYTVVSGQVLVVDAAHGLLKNDTDPVEKQNLTVVNWTKPKNGTVDVKQNGSFIYHPKEGFIGLDRFDYVVRDSGGANGTTYVEIEVVKPRSAAAIIIIIVIVIVCAVAGAIYFIRKKNEGGGTENPQRLFS
eukprot:TRINITY_DN1502_c0_g1_i1.p1 TRINITY_DN1502_c0_g1~~TRINITY_DN1502_c0_g1_i1.p1  ORF type:complete len:1140 (-),score=257.47 TRINITY_DN1502_c0_g1_i1:215-3610(-)